VQRQPDFNPWLGRTITAAQEYCLDAWQRGILFLDVLRERGNIFWERQAEAVPNVLQFDWELICDGRKLPRPVNYGLVRIIPPEGTKIDPAKPPFIVVDPRAGHGPGIGGMKQESEIGLALAAGHACYLIGFTPDPAPGQTVEDVCRAEAAFVEEVARRHPEAEGKPVIVANCQAGWQILMMAAVNPDLPGPILVAGSPLSYWAGVHGRNPMRYSGGLLGGTWLTALTGDVGAGLFDGAWLIANFESLDLANTFWKKPYNVYSKVDTEPRRFLDFEAYWGTPVLLEAGEMQWIVDNLFVGDKLATGGLRTSDGVRIDLRNIRSPIIVFCSWGDNITPPQQALDWITDIYDDEREIAANGQTIVYTLHQSIGHLGIFVSGKVAAKEHREFVSCMDMIDLMPPGLYEAVITEVEEDTANPSLVHGKYLFRLEQRTLDDIRALGHNSPEDIQRFETTARVSEVNNGLYRTYLRPVVRTLVTESAAETIRQMHPHRLRFAVFSDRNPLMRPLEGLADAVRGARAPVSAHNPFLAVEKAMAAWIEGSLESIGKLRDAMHETVFMNTYASPLLQAMVGLPGQAPSAGRRIERDLVREADEARLRSELENRFDVGGLIEAFLRALVYVTLPERAADERGFAMARAIRAAAPPETAQASESELKETLKEQYLLVCLDEERAVEAIPKLLPKDVEQRRQASEALRKVATARGAVAPESRRRLARIEQLFDGKAAGHA